MTVIRLRGLAAGLSDLTVRPAAAALVSGPHRVEITPSRGQGIAPAGVTFEARASGFDTDRPEHDLRYKWSFGDPGATFSALTERAGAMGWTDADTAYGPFAAHTFAPDPATFAALGDDQPASALRYTVTCEVTDGTHTARGQVEIVIDNPDHVFAGSRTMLFSAVADFSEAPTSLHGGPRWEDDIQKVYQALSAGNVRVLMRRGEEVEFSHVIRDTAGPLQLGAFGSGAAPRLWKHDRRVLAVRKNLGGEIAVHGIDIRNDYDPATETGQDAGGLQTAITLEADAAADYTFHQIDVANVSTGMLVSVKAEYRWSCVVSDSRIRDNRDFGSLVMDCDKFAFIGCVIRRHPDSMGGGAGALSRRGYYNDHGPIRIARPHPHGYVVLDALELFSNAGWSFKGGRPAHQSCLRWNTDGTVGSRLSLSRSIGEGGDPVWNLNTNKGGATDSPGVHVLDKVIGLCSAASHQAFEISHGGTTLRNFIGFRADTPNQNLGTSKGMVMVGWDSWDGGANKASSVHVYSGTLVNWFDPVARNNVSGGGIADVPPVRERPNDGQKQGTFDDTRFDNLVFHAPNMQSPTDASADIDLGGPALFAPLYRGLKWINRHPADNVTDTGEPLPDQPTLDPAYATPATVADGGALVTLPRPRPGGAAFEAALDGRVALDDIFGRLRGPRPSKGAVEPD